MTETEMDDMNDPTRTPGRREVDGAHLLKWVPFTSLIFLMLVQTIYVTRYVSGLETSNTMLLKTVAALEGKVEALTASVNQGAVPSAQAQWRLDAFDRAITDLRALANDNSRRITAVESRSRVERER